MFKVILLCVCITFSFSKEIVGYGGTFAQNFMSEFKSIYESSTGDKLTYKSIGSLGAIKQLRLKRSNFAISDINSSYMNYDGFVVKPILSGNITISYNLEDTHTLNLTPEIIGKIYEGDIQFWDDELIAKLNPELNLKHENIAVLHRYDGSGTTFNFTKFISLHYKEWNLGANEFINFKVGVGKKGNESIAETIKNTPNSIGYVAYPDAKTYGLKSANLVLNSKVFTPNSTSYPIKNYTFFIFKQNDNSAKKFLYLIYKNAESISKNCAYELVIEQK